MTFLTTDDVLALHDAQLQRFGGAPGLRSYALLDSAVAQASATSAGVPLHEDVYAMAAAYLFHIVRNHPFVDGNKRAGLLAALVFLDVNGATLRGPAPELYDLTAGVAEGLIDKAGIAEVFQRLRAR
jgi:death-on-curing protein